jgi:hypothetical protein
VTMADKTGYHGGTDRGQAYTLEGLTAAFFLLLATLLALQAVILTPITVGSVDEGAQSRLRAEASDVLQTTANRETEDLDYHVRHWAPLDRTFAGAESPRVGYGTDGPPGVFGRLLEESFETRGRNYNILVRYRRNNSTEAGIQRMVYQGEPSRSAVVASYTLSLYDDMRLTGPERSRTTIGEMDTNATDNDDGYFYVPDVAEGPLYNVVEVRLIVW